MKWKVYHKALLPDCLPHESGISEREVQILLREKNCFFARFTTEFDSPVKTQWWWCLKDDKLDISKLKAKRRYEIVRALKNVEVKIINPLDYIEDLYQITRIACLEYPLKYRVNITRDEFIRTLDEWIGMGGEYWGCFDKDTNTLCAYAICVKQGDCVALSVVKVLPAYMTKGVNAAIVYSLCCKYLNQDEVRYIYDGERNLRHETNYQEYLIKYFNFRYVYCKLNVIYRPWVKWTVNILFPFRSLFRLLSLRSSLFYNIYCVLRQEEIRRTFL